MAQESKVEKFSRSELVNLRNELLAYSNDSWLAADVVSAFLVGRGYGVNPETIRLTVAGIDAFSGSTHSMQAVLESIAYVM